MNRRVNIGDWQVDWDAGWIRSRRILMAKRKYPDPRIMAVFKLLVGRAGEVVSTEMILQDVWQDRVVGRDSVSTAIYQLRQILGDQSQRSNYIRTEARRGYRLIAAVSDVQFTARRARAICAGIAAACLIVVVAAWSIDQVVDNDPALILVEEMDVQTPDASMNLLHDAIGSTLLGELVKQLPGRVIVDASPVAPTYILQSKIVACDLGPALLVRLMDTDESRFLWYQAYRLEDWKGAADQPTLVQAVAHEVGAFVDTLQE
jgi:DNA-binding winged helix-turn-helix (wHTH) protein